MAEGTSLEDRREERRSERRERLADAALELFSSRGFDHTSVDDIVAAARTSKTGFYEFWDSREDCLRDLLDSHGERLLGSVVKAASEGGDHGERLRRGLAGFVRGCIRDRRLARLLLVESVGLSGPVEESRQRLQGRFARLVEAEVRAHGSGRHPGVDADLFGRAVVGATQEATAQLIGQRRPDAERVIRGLWAIFAPAGAGRSR